MKKLLIVFVGFLALLAAAIAVAPFFIQVDQYRPTIEKMVNEQIQGKLTLGKLALNLWGSIKIKVDGVKLENTQGKEMLGVQEAYFVLPWTSIWTGEPRLEFVMKKPKVLATRAASGKIDLLGLLSPPQAAPTAAAPSAPAAPQAAAATAAKQAPAPAPVPAAPAPAAPTAQSAPAAPAQKAQALPAIRNQSHLTFILEEVGLTTDAVTQSATRAFQA